MLSEYSKKEFRRLLQNSTIKIKASSEVSLGTGFWISPYLAVTCHHVIEGHENAIELHCNNKIYKINKCQIYNFEEVDVAIILVEGAAKDNVVYVIPADFINHRDQLFCFGYTDEAENGEDTTLEFGGIYTENNNTLYKLKNDDIFSGLSGSPILNEETGYVVGMIHASFVSEEAKTPGGLAIPIELITKKLKTIKIEKIEIYNSDVWLECLSKAYPFKTINSLFINHEKKNKFSLYDFFGANPRAQWWGIINGLYAKVTYQDTIRNEIKERISIPGNSIVGVFFGVSGMGKSSLARDIAIYFSNYINVIWVDTDYHLDVLQNNTFINYISSFAQSKTLLILDGWGEFGSSDENSRLLSKLINSSISNLYILITTRFIDSLEKLSNYKHCYDFDSAIYTYEDKIKIYNNLVIALNKEKKIQKLNNLPKPSKTDKIFHIIYVVLRNVLSNNIENFDNTKNYEFYFIETVKSDILLLNKSDKNKRFSISLIAYAILVRELGVRLSLTSFYFIMDIANTNENIIIGTDFLKWGKSIISLYISMTENQNNKITDVNSTIIFNKDEFHEIIYELSIKDPSIREIYNPDDCYKTVNDLITYADNGTSSRIYAHIIRKNLNWFSSTQIRDYFYTLIDRNNNHQAYIETIYKFENSLFHFNNEELIKLTPKIISLMKENDIVVNKYLRFCRNKFDDITFFDILLKSKTVGVSINKPFIGFCKPFLNKENSLQYAKILIENDIYDSFLATTCLKVIDKYDKENATTYSMLIINNSLRSNTVPIFALIILEKYNNESIKEACIKFLEKGTNRRDQIGYCFNILKDIDNQKVYSLAETYLTFNRAIESNFIIVKNRKPEIAANFAKNYLSKKFQDNGLAFRCLEMLFEIDNFNATNMAYNILKNRSKSGKLIILSLKIIKNNNIELFFEYLKEQFYRIDTTKQELEPIVDFIKIEYSDIELNEFDFSKISQTAVPFLYSLAEINKENINNFLKQVFETSGNRHLYNYTIKQDIGTNKIWLENAAKRLNLWKNTNRSHVLLFLKKLPKEDKLVIKVCNEIIINWKHEIKLVPNGHILEALSNPNILFDRKSVIKSIQNFIKINPNIVSDRFIEKLNLLS